MFYFARIDKYEIISEMDDACSSRTVRQEMAMDFYKATGLLLPPAHIESLKVEVMPSNTRPEELGFSREMPCVWRKIVSGSTAPTFGSTNRTQLDLAIAIDAPNQPSLFS